MKAALSKIASLGKTLIGGADAAASITETAATANGLWRELTARAGQTVFQSASLIQRDAKALGERLRRHVMRGRAGVQGITAYAEQQQQLATAVRAAEPKRQQRVAAARSRLDAAEREKARLKAREAEITDRQARALAEQARRGDDAADRYATAVAEGDEAAAAAAQAEVARIEAEGAANEAAARGDAPVLRAVLGRLAQCELEISAARAEMAEAAEAVEEAAIECAQLEWNAAAARLVITATNCKLEHHARGRPWHRDGQLLVPLFKRGGECPATHLDDRGVPLFVPRSFHEIAEASGVLEPADPLFAEVREFLRRLDELEREAGAAEASERSTMHRQQPDEGLAFTVEQRTAAHVARLYHENTPRQVEPVSAA